MPLGPASASSKGVQEAAGNLQGCGEHQAVLASAGERCKTNYLLLSEFFPEDVIISYYHLFMLLLEASGERNLAQRRSVAQPRVPETHVPTS